MGQDQTLVEKIRLGRKPFPRSNTLAYYAKTNIVLEKKVYNTGPWQDCPADHPQVNVFTEIKKISSLLSSSFRLPKLFALENVAKTSTL